jgi:cyclopropane fatty-acyl-phospholipid synthase-like methyltransferase
LPPEAFKPRPVIPFVATPDDVVLAMLNLAGVGRRDVLYDLGSGDGRIVIAAARHFGAKAVGYEINAGLVRSSRAAIKKAKLEKVATIEQLDIFDIDLDRATVVTLYLTEEANRRLVPQLAQMRPGARVVTHRYPIPGYKATTTKKVSVRIDGEDREHTIWLYTIPLEEEP